jgi:DUF4097 and DUF4098 domain-containing protein YvlB
MARLQRAQYKAQYAYLRRRPSFVGPLLLIMTGIVALLLETGRLDAERFWPWYARWWPALLVLIGLGLLAEYFLDRNNPQPGRRSFGGAVWLIVLLSLLGAGSHATRNVWPWPDDYWDHIGENGIWFPMMGEEHVETHTLVKPISSTGTLTIENARGDVSVSTVTGGSADEVRVDARQVVHANSDEAARRDLDATVAQLSSHGPDATLSTSGRDGASVDLKVTVPAGIALVVHTTHGDVAVSGLRRSVEASNSHGSVTLDSLGAGAHVQMDHGDVTAHDLAGDLAIDGRADDVSISGVKGQSLLNGDFFGDTRIDGTGSLVHFHSSRTDLDVPRLGGQLTLDSSDLRLANPSGGLRLSTRAKDVEVTGLTGDAHIENSNGDLEVSAGMPMGNLDLIDHTGSIVVTVPSNASFSVEGSAGEDDDVTSEFPLLNQAGSGRKTLSGQVGQGGPHLQLSTDHGDLTLHRGGPAAPQSAGPPERPERPETPERPERPERHLHSKAGEPLAPTVQ